MDIVNYVFMLVLVQGRMSKDRYQKYLSIGHFSVESTSSNMHPIYDLDYFNTCAMAWAGSCRNAK